MKKKASFRIEEELLDFVNLLAETRKISKSKAMELILAASEEMVGIAGLLMYSKHYEFRDKRYNDTSYL